MKPLLVRVTPFLAPLPRTGDSPSRTFIFEGGGVIGRRSGGVSPDVVSSADEAPVVRLERFEEPEMVRKISLPPSLEAWTAFSISSAADERRRGIINAALALTFLEEDAVEASLIASLRGRSRDTSSSSSSSLLFSVTRSAVLNILSRNS